MLSLSYWVSRQAPELEMYWKLRGEWWDGYTGQKTVVFDDFYGWIPFDELLRVMDRFPHQVPIKGGFLNFTAANLYITSNKMPEEWYDPGKCDLRAMFRRFDTALAVSAPGHLAGEIRQAIITSTEVALVLPRPLRCHFGVKADAIGCHAIEAKMEKISTATMYLPLVLK